MHESCPSHILHSQNIQCVNDCDPGCSQVVGCIHRVLSYSDTMNKIQVSDKMHIYYPDFLTNVDEVLCSLTLIDLQFIYLYQQIIYG